jgi:hypothetical protein
MYDISVFPRDLLLSSLKVIRLAVVSLPKSKMLTALYQLLRTRQGAYLSFGRAAILKNPITEEREKVISWHLKIPQHMNFPEQQMDG